MKDFTSAMVKHKFAQPSCGSEASGKLFTESGAMQGQCLARLHRVHTVSRCMDQTVGQVPQKAQDHTGGKAG